MLSGSLHVDELSGINALYFVTNILCDAVLPHVAIEAILYNCLTSLCKQNPCMKRVSLLGPPTHPLPA